MEGLVYENKTFLVAMLVLCLVLAGCSNSSNSSKDSDKKMKARLIIVKAKLQISAAASLTDVSKALAKEFKRITKTLILNLITVVLVR